MVGIVVDPIAAVEATAAVVAATTVPHVDLPRTGTEQTRRPSRETLHRLATTPIVVPTTKVHGDGE
ncbi:hypothetical protein LTR53_020551, partial [Teratosphaeriaceae sp. CCFEE 6253]